jgi:hypothetical protein
LSSTERFEVDAADDQSEDSEEALLGYNAAAGFVAKSARLNPPPSFLDIDPREVGDHEAGNIHTTTCTKYFRRDDARRVTLDSSDILDGSISSDNINDEMAFKTNARNDDTVFDAAPCDVATPRTKKLDWCVDDTIDSPPDYEGHGSQTNFLKDKCGSRATSRLFVSGHQYSSVVDSRKTRRIGPLESAFKRQKQLSSEVQSQTPSWRKGSGHFPNHSSSRPKKTSKALKSYFQPVKQSESVSLFQLQMDTKETKDDFLWNTP